MRSFLNNVVLLFASTSLFSLFGCATIYEGVTGPHAVNFTSEPSGATVRFDNGDECETPCEREVHRYRAQPVEIELIGYKSQTINLERRIHYGFWFNALLGSFGLVTAVVDIAAGHLMTFTEFDHHIELLKSESEAGPKLDEAPLPPKDSPAIETNNPPEPASLHPSATALRIVKESFSEEYMKRVVRQYYGDRPDSGQIVNRIYLILATMYDSKEALDVDEAVRRDFHAS